MSDVIKDFVQAARDMSISAAAARLGLSFHRGWNPDANHDHSQPCPACGGRDRFAFNPDKGVWNCRGAEGGRDAIGMAAHVLGLDLKRRDGFLAACSAVLGEPVPEGGETESAEDRRARLDRLEARRLESEAEERRRGAAQADFREAERKKARGIYFAGRPLSSSSAIAEGRRYLAQRGAGVPPHQWLNVSRAVTYWHGTDDAGRPAELHCGPAMVAPFIVPAGADVPGAELIVPGWQIVGCHITWIDLQNAPKFRPLLVDQQTGELLPTKKMRGSKKGGLIPLAGVFAARRWVCGEGIENVLAVALAEGFRTDSFYCAAGDLGNLAGPADPASAFPHPELTRTDRRGVTKPVMVQGPMPKPGSAGEAVPVPDYVDELLLVADGDSERVMTAAAMARARNRRARPGRLIPVVWPKGGDFSELMAAG